MSEVFVSTARDDPKELEIEAWTYEDGRHTIFRGGLNYWLMPNGSIDIGTVAVEPDYQRQGVASRLFDQLRTCNPEVTNYKSTVGSDEGGFLFRSLARRHSDLVFDLHCEDGSIFTCD